jgi:hypothetical protein
MTFNLKFENEQFNLEFNYVLNSLTLGYGIQGRRKHEKIGGGAPAFGS